MTNTIDTYFEMWNSVDAAERRRLVEAAWAPEGRYADPVLAAAGYDELVAMVDGVHAQFPGCAFRRTSGVDAHGLHVRFAWELAGPDGVVVAGIDVGELAEDGRLQRITGFFGELSKEMAA